ncbi:hypothetical protein FJT64_022804 [Amphibalanus amphitrite]|uniref:Uncharacterized protein n=1 Tax=Amphibalanus amphitrite TaxID=1232801 RepID=A0A6A4WFQ4_AMPAM|nr:hypothetical protein FJT64_022804 [Amphibalanus amphitrite]
MADSGVAFTFDERRATSLRQLLTCDRRTDPGGDPRSGHLTTEMPGERRRLPDHLLYSDLSIPDRWCVHPPCHSLENHNLLGQHGSALQHGGEPV